MCYCYRKLKFDLFCFHFAAGVACRFIDTAENFKTQLKLKI